MAELESIFVRRPAEGRLVGLVGDVYRFIAAGDETGGGSGQRFDLSRLTRANRRLDQSSQESAGNARNDAGSRDAGS